MANPPSSLASHKLPPELAKVEQVNFQVYNAACPLPGCVTISLQLQSVPILAKQSHTACLADPCGA